MSDFDEQPNRFQPNFKLIDHLKTIPGLDFETLHPVQFPVRLYDPLLINYVGLNKKNATRDSVNAELNRVLTVIEKHLSARASDNDKEQAFLSFQKSKDELREKPGKKPNITTFLNLLLGLSQTRYRYWHTHPQEVADTVLQCNIDLVVLQSVLVWGIHAMGPGRQPARLATPELIQIMVDQTRQRRDELVASGLGPTEISVAPQGQPETPSPSVAGPSATQPFTQEENEAVFENPDLNEMIQDLGDMLNNPGEAHTSF